MTALDGNSIWWIPIVWIPVIAAAALTYFVVSARDRVRDRKRRTLLFYEVIGTLPGPASAFGLRPVYVVWRDDRGLGVIVPFKSGYSHPVFQGPGGTLYDQREFASRADVARFLERCPMAPADIAWCRRMLEDTWT